MSVGSSSDSVHWPEGLSPAGCRGTSDHTGIGLAHLCVHENVLAEERTFSDFSLFKYSISTTEIGNCQYVFDGNDYFADSH